jgi:hypothetical protein
MEPAAAPELAAFRNGQALVAIPVSAARRERRGALLALLGAAPASDDPDLARALGVIQAVLDADAAFDGTATSTEAAAALDRMSDAAFPLGSHARRLALNDRPEDVARLTTAWGFDAADAPVQPDLPANLPVAPGEVPDAATIGALLDACLGLSLHLRIAALPLLRARQAAAAGDLPAALVALALLDQAMTVHPWAAPAPAALCAVASADVRLARLHRGAVLAALAVTTDDPAPIRAVETLHGRAAPVPVTAPADIDTIAAGGSAAAVAAVARWRKAAFRTRPHPRESAIAVEAELYLPRRFDPAAPAIDPAAARRVLERWYAGACFRPVAAAMAQLLAVAPRPAESRPLDEVLARHDFATRAANAATSALTEPIRRWEAAAVGAAGAGSPPLRLALADWLADMKAWQAATGDVLRTAKQDIGAVMAGQRLDLLASTAADAAGIPPLAARARAERPVPAVPTIDHRPAQTIRLNLSLAERAPVALQELRAGPGRLLFHTSLRDLHRCYPGATLLRLEQMRFRLEGVVLPPAGLAATLTLDAERPRPLVLEAKPGHSGGITLTPPRAAGAALRRDTLDVDWCLDLPKAANRLDLAVLADVIVELRLAVVLDAPPPSGPVAVSGELVGSLARDFPSAWKALTTGGEVRVALVPARFPPHVDGLVLTDIAVQLLGPAAAAVPEITLLHGGRSVSAALHAGVANTQRPDPAGEHPWLALRGRKPTGTWGISLPKTPDRTGITDVVLTVGYAGELPPWPA